MQPNIEKINKTNREKRWSPRHGLKHLPLALTAAALLGMGFWLLWNLAGVPIFEIPPLTYWQALGAMLLSGALLRIAMFRSSHHRRNRSKHFATSGCRSAGYHAENGSGDI